MKHTMAIRISCIHFLIILHSSECASANHKLNVDSVSTGAAAADMNALLNVLEAGVPTSNPTPTPTYTPSTATPTVSPTTTAPTTSTPTATPSSATPSVVPSIAPTSKPSILPTIRPSPAPSTQRPTTMVRTQVVITMTSIFSDVSISAFNSTSGADIFGQAAALDQMNIYPEDIFITGLMDNATLSPMQDFEMNTLPTRDEAEGSSVLHSTDIFLVEEKRKLEAISEYIEVYWKVQFAYEERGFDNATHAYNSFARIFRSNIDDSEFIAIMRFSDSSFRDIIHHESELLSVASKEISPTAQPTYAPVSSPSGSGSDPDVFVPVIVTFILLMVLICCIFIYCFYKYQDGNDFKNEDNRPYEDQENGQWSEGKKSENDTRVKKTPRLAGYSVHPTPSRKAAATAADVISDHRLNEKRNIAKQSAGAGRILPTIYSPEKKERRFAASVLVKDDVNTTTSTTQQQALNTPEPVVAPLESIPSATTPEQVDNNDWAPMQGISPTSRIEDPIYEPLNHEPELNYSPGADISATNSSVASNVIPNNTTTVHADDGPIHQMSSHQASQSAPGGAPVGERVVVDEMSSMTNQDIDTPQIGGSSSRGGRHGSNRGVDISTHVTEDNTTDTPWTAEVTASNSSFKTPTAPADLTTASPSPTIHHEEHSRANTLSAVADTASTDINVTDKNSTHNNSVIGHNASSNDRQNSTPTSSNAPSILGGRRAGGGGLSLAPIQQQGRQNLAPL